MSIYTLRAVEMQKNAKLNVNVIDNWCIYYPRTFDFSCFFNQMHKIVPYKSQMGNWDVTAESTG